MPTATDKPKPAYLNSRPLAGGKAASTMPEPELVDFINDRVLFLRQCRGCLHYDPESMIVGWLLGQGVQPKVAVDLTTRWARHYENIG